MSADIERESFNPKSHFSRVIYQQGRSLLASDLNEQGAIFQYYLREFISDFVGKRWRTEGSFEIKSIETKNFTISKGHFYIDGLLCINEVECWYAPKKQAVIQPMHSTPEWDEIKDESSLNGYAVYLECWERHINSIQRPDIREVALGGPDTSARLEIAWQVRILTNKLAIDYINSVTSALGNISTQTKPALDDIKNKLEAFKKAFNEKITDNYCKVTQDLLGVLDAAPPRLRVWANKSGVEEEACSIAPNSHYTGLENQLYRIEIHSPGVVSTDKNSTQPSFKWSRENGSVIFHVLNVAPDTDSKEFTVDLETLRRDRRYSLCVGDWVELISDEIEFGQNVLPLAKITKIDPTSARLTLETKSKVNFTGCNLLRRWDQKDGDINDLGCINITEAFDDDYANSGWIPLENGISVQFLPGGNYRKPDFWLVNARSATRNIDWPQEISYGKKIPAAKAPDGIKRHRAALTAIDGTTQAPKSFGCVMKPICPDT